MPHHILLTGGNGFIGSHTTVKLIDSGYEVTIVDNLSNSKLECLDRVKKLCTKPELIHFFNLDVSDPVAMDKLFSENKFDCVIHFAAYKCVGESVSKPLMYYRNNIAGTLTLLETMKAHNCKNIVFSSSATVYGESCVPPAVETFPTGSGITNPYGRTKYMMEEILKDVHYSDKDFGVVLLRYFNPVGAHESGLIGEDPNGIPNNLMPYVQQVAIGKRPHVNVFGDDYATPDGTGVRDYIHVQDLAMGHVAALNWLFAKGGKLLEVFNLGSGKGTSVLDMIKGMEKACGHEVKYVIAPRRAGDVAAVYCDPSKAAKELGWKVEKTVEDMCRDSWSWQSKNPNGYEKAGK